MEQNNNIKLCKICGINECKLKQLRCQKCISKINNEQLKNKQYYKQYYETNKEEYLEQCKLYYRTKHPEIKPLGRPKKLKNI